MYFLSWLFHCAGYQWSISLGTLQKTGMKTNSENPGPLYLQHVLDAHFFLSHAYITLTFFNWYWVEIKTWRRVTWKTYVEECTTAGWEGKYLFVPSSLVCCHSFAKTIFIWKLRFACLLDQNASLRWQCCHNNSFDTSYLWNHFENWRCEENNSLLSGIYITSLYIYLMYLQKFLREASCITVI